MITALPTLHPEAIAWAKAVATNGGVVTTRSLRAASQFCGDIDRAGIRNKFLRLSLLCGGDLTAARVPLYRAAAPTGTQYGAAIDYNIGPFTSGDYSEATGINGNGNSKCLDTEVDIGDLSAFGAEYDNCHVSVYRREDGSAGGFDLGAWYAHPTLEQAVCYVLYTDASGRTFYAGDYQGDWVVGSTFNSLAPGFWFAQHGASDSDILKNNASVEGSQSRSASLAFSELSGLNLLVMAGNEDGSPGTFKSGRIGAYSFGKAMDSTQRTALYNAMLAFQTALGRNV